MSETFSEKEFTTKSTFLKVHILIIYLQFQGCNENALYYPSPVATENLCDFWQNAGLEHLFMTQFSNVETFNIY